MHQLKQVLGRGVVVVGLLVPPLLHALIGVVVASHIDEPSAFFHPAGNVGVCLRVEGLHVGVGEQQHANVAPRVGVGGVLEVGDAYRNASLQQGECQPVEVGELGVVVAFHRLG